MLIDIENELPQSASLTAPSGGSLGFLVQPQPPSRGRWLPQQPEGVLSIKCAQPYAVNPHSILTAYSGWSIFTPKPSIFQPTVEI